MLRQAKQSDISSLARIHHIELNSDFLSSLGEKFLQLIYLSLIQSDNTHIYISELNNNVQGFVVGSKDFNKDFKKVIFSNFIKFSIILSSQIFKNTNIIKNIFDTFFYTKKQGNDLVKAELVVIAISKKFHRKGIGKKLIENLEKKFAKDNIREYKVSVNKANQNANSFYKSLGFNKYKEFILYGKKINLYIKQIK